jgi:hypothetical protein
VDHRPNIEKSQREQQWSFLATVVSVLCFTLFNSYVRWTPGRWIFIVAAYSLFMIAGAFWLRSPARDVQAIVSKRRRFDRWNALAALVMAPCIWLLSEGDWVGRAYTAFFAYTAFAFIRRSWLWRIGERNAQALAETASPLGLEPNRVDGRVYEGMRGKDYVRVWIEEPTALLNRGGPAEWVGLILFAPIVAALAWLGWGWILAGAVIMFAWTWYAIRPRVYVITSRDDGTSERQTIRGLTDVASTIGRDRLEPVEADLVPLEPEVDLPDLLAEIRIATDANLPAALRMVGEAGYPETIPLLLAALRQRREMSPQSAVTADAAVARIHERHHLPDAGTLAITASDDAGGLAVAHQTGTLALPPRDRSS